MTGRICTLDTKGDSEKFDFRTVVEEVERRLGTEAARNMHRHFSKIEYTNKSERRHPILGKARYGPDFEMLAELIAEFNMHPVMICETPLLDVDAVKMHGTLRKVTEKYEALLSYKRVITQAAVLL